MAESGCMKDGAFQNLEVTGTTITKQGLVYLTTTGDKDLSGLTGDTTVLINVALADTNFIRLPEATTSNGGMHIQVIFGIACLVKVYVGFVTSKIQGGAVAVGDTNEGAGSSLDYATAIADAGDNFLRVEFTLDNVHKAGGTGGTVLDFWYPGVANKIIYRGHLISEIDNVTLDTHFTTTAINA
jgi:hypothetical protein